MIVRFENVGRNKDSWEAECNELTFEFLYKECKKVLMSDNIDFTIDGKIVVGGFRIVGEYEARQKE